MEEGHGVCRCEHLHQVTLGHWAIGMMLVLKIRAIVRNVGHRWPMWLGIFAVGSDMFTVCSDRDCQEYHKTHCHHSTENRSLLCKKNIRFFRFISIILFFCNPVPYLFTIKAGIASLNSAGGTLQSESKIPVATGPPGPLPPENAHSGIVLSDNFPCELKKNSSSQSHLGDLWELWFGHRAVQ